MLSVPFEERGVATANGARWDPATRQTIYIGRDLPYGLTPYASPDYSWERWIEDDLNGSVRPTTRGRTRMKPRDHQVEAAKKIAKAAHAGYRGFVEADDVGVGKTLAAWCGTLLVAKVRPVRNVLIVCPKGVIAHWRSTIAAVGDGGLRITVINYDRAKSLLAVPESAAAAKTTRTKNKRIAAAGTPLVDWDVVIMDESHKTKNADSQRSKAMNKIARYAAAANEAPFVIWMSATVGQNPVELGYLAPLLAQLTGAKKSDLADFGQWLADQGFSVEYNDRFRKWDWCPLPADAPPAQVAVIERARKRDIERMYGMLFADPNGPTIRRLPTDIAGWPEIQRILLPVELDAAERALYAQAWTEFRSAMAMSQRGKDPKKGLVARLRFRQKASLLRVPGTVEQALDLLDNGHQVVISVEFHETLDAIRAALAGHKIAVAEFSGRNPESREAERVAFQRGDRQVMLFTVTEAISLHAGQDLTDGTFATDAPRTTLVHDPRYSGLDSIQIEGRGHRDGQLARVFYLFAAGTVEEDIVRVLLGRVSTTKAMQGDDVTLLRQLEAVLDAGSAAAASVPQADVADVATGGPGIPATLASVVPPVPLARGGGLPVTPPAAARRGAPQAPGTPGAGGLGDALAGGVARQVSRPRFTAADAADLRRSMQGGA